MGAPDLDEIDKQIIKLLQENSRITLVDIAREIEELTENAIRNRIDKLEAEGYISDYTVRLNPKKFGKNIMTIFNLNVLPEKIPLALKKLKKMDEITDVYLTTGGYSVTIIGYFEDHTAVAKFIKRELKSIQMVDYDVITVLEKVKNELYGL